MRGIGVRKLDPKEWVGTVDRERKEASPHAVTGPRLSHRGSRFSH